MKEVKERLGSHLPSSHRKDRKGDETKDYDDEKFSDDELDNFKVD